MKIEEIIHTACQNIYDMTNIGDLPHDQQINYLNRLIETLKKNLGLKNTIYTVEYDFVTMSVDVSVNGIRKSMKWSKNAPTKEQTDIHQILVKLINEDDL